jgi:hypothetical protein
MSLNVPPQPPCSQCKQPTTWGCFSLKLGDNSKSHAFCEACFRKFVEGNTMALLLLNKLFPGVEWRKKKSATEKSDVPELRS